MFVIIRSISENETKPKNTKQTKNKAKTKNKTETWRLEQV